MIDFRCESLGTEKTHAAADRNIAVADDVCRREKIQIAIIALDPACAIVDAEADQCAGFLTRSFQGAGSVRVTGRRVHHLDLFSRARFPRTMR